MCCLLGSSGAKIVMVVESTEDQRQTEASIAEIAEG